ncbi:MAG: 16S rRNA (cytidine(1402)-2'-O)-methyltransferase [Acidobacteria bacterium]|nr:16S rRNA (cytidine(1402)-2'-O)-methyltransferase [Acidobacteriota bacterium]
MAGTLFVVATPIGNLEDISPRAIKVLREVALIAAEDTRRTGHLLQRFGLTTRTTSFHEHSLKGKTSVLLERLLAGDDVALVSDAGTPGISDPGDPLIRAAYDAGIRVTPIPGPSAAVTAVSASGFGGGGFIFLGFPPTKGSARAAWIAALRAASAAVGAAVFYEAPHRIVDTLAQLRDALGDIEVVICRELTKIHEEVIHGSLGTLRLDEPRGEFTVVLNIGQIAAELRTADALAVVTAEDLAREFRDLTENQQKTRRQAIAAIARKHQLQARDVYARLEVAKSSGV